MIWTTVPKLPWKEAEKGCEWCKAKGKVFFVLGRWLCGECREALYYGLRLVPAR